MRSQLEVQFGLSPTGEPYRGVDVPWPPKGYLVAAIFGPHMNMRHSFGPTRIMVRDANLLTGGQTETKTGVRINRSTGGPADRALYTVERVAAGSTFRLRIDLQVLDIDTSQQACAHNGQKGGVAMVEFVKAGLKLIELTGLGSGVSRGSGEVEFRDLKLDGAPFTLPAQVPNE